MSLRLPQAVEGVLFDLDGTLLDSAPDLYAALLAQCVEEGIEPPPYPPVRQSCAAPLPRVAKRQWRR